MHWYSVCYKEIFRPFLRFFPLFTPFCAVFFSRFLYLYCLYLALNY